MNDSVLKSNEDASVNFITKSKIGFLEARYVRRKPNYFVTYLSSQTGCNRGCKFCHLTATDQTKFTNASLDDYMLQANQVFEHYLSQPKAEEVNFNFMSRGEALANTHLLENGYEIFNALSKLSIQHEVAPKFNLSTIMPKTLGDKDLFKLFMGFNPTIYYSLYSTNEEFRKKWMPGAMPVEKALANLKRYQKVTNKIINVHYAFIKGENDSEQDVRSVTDALKKENLVCNFNIVRYNPFSQDQGEESSEEVILRNAKIFSENISGYVKVINRVGFDVKASCGMFVR